MAVRRTAVLCMAVPLVLGNLLHLICADAAGWNGASATRQLQQSACKAIPRDLLAKADKVMAQPMNTLKLQYPVYVKDKAKLGEMADGCTYVLGRDGWHKQIEIPEGYMESLRKLADIAAFNAKPGGCPKIRDQALAKWKAVVLSWARKGGFLSPSSTPTGQYYCERALSATAASYLKVRGLLKRDKGTSDAVVAYIAKMQKYSAGINGPFNNHEIFKQASLMFAGLVFGKGAAVKQSADNIVKQLNSQLSPKGYIPTEKRCTRTFFYQTSYLEGALFSLATYKSFSKTLPGDFAKVKPAIDLMIKNLEGGDPAPSKFLASVFGYSSKVVDGMEKVEAAAAVKRCRQLYNFLVGSAAAVPVFAGDSAYVGYLNNLKF